MSQTPRRTFLRISASEMGRIALLILCGVWLASPLFTRGLVGGGDAVWYRHQVADAVAQFREGVFPVFVGQTQESFNGAVHPIRTAPYLQYLCGLIDLMTGQTQEAHVLLHAAAAVSLMGAILGAYASLLWLDPTQRWRAFFLAVIYGTAPGVIGIPYAQDLYMSTMALPWIPAALAAALRCINGDVRVAPVVLGASVAALLWAHTPIALYTCVAVSALFLVCAGLSREQGRLGGVFKAAFVAGVVCLVLGSYPVVSVLGLRGAEEGIATRVFDRESLLREIAATFPGVLQPVSGDRPLLTFIQPGYAVLLLLILGLFSTVAARDRDKGPLVLFSCALGYLTLMLPTPGVTAWVWRHLPETWVSITNIWPMQRLAPLMAALVVVGFQLAFSRSKGERVHAVRLSPALAALALVWSLWQAGSTRDLAERRTQPAEEVARASVNENVNVSEIAYQQLSKRPAYFIHGVADPRLEVRLFSTATGKLIAASKKTVEDGATSAWLELRPQKTTNPGLLEFAPKLRLEPGVRYVLTFDFSQEELRGVLRVSGEQIRRVYVLPSAGEPLGFGMGPGQEKSIALWTSKSTPETAALEFIPDSDADRRKAFAAFARVRLSPVDPQTLPVEVTSLLPLVMRIRAPEASTVETMRVFIPGWTAEVNGQRVQTMRSAQGLVAFDVPTGSSEARLIYRAPASVLLAFWLNAVGASVLAVSALLAAIRSMRAPVFAEPAPPKSG